MGKLFLDLWKDKTLSDLSVEAVASPDPVATGETLFYTVRVANDGPDRAEGVRLQALHTLGEGLVFKGATASNRSMSCNSSQFQGPVCDLGPVDDGETVEATLEFDLMVRAHGERKGECAVRGGGRPPRAGVRDRRSRGRTRSRATTRRRS